MKSVKILFALMVTFVCCSAFTLKDKEKEAKPVYLFGLAASFNDSIVYCTEIQQLDSVTLTKDGFLPSRNEYAGQLTNYIEFQQGKKNYTSMIYFSDKKKKIDKEAVKLMNKYMKSEGLVLQKLEITSFVFKPVKE